MNSSRDRWFILGASTASLLVHTALALLLLDVQLGSTHAALFDAGIDDLAQMEVIRWPDEFVESAPTDPQSTLAVEQRSPDNQSAIRKSTQQLIDRSQPRSLLPADARSRIDPQIIALADPDPPAPGEARIAPADSSPRASTGNLSWSTSPPIDLPRYISPTDEPELVAPQPGRIDVSPSSSAALPVRAGAGGVEPGTGLGIGLDLGLPPLPGAPSLPQAGPVLPTPDLKIAAPIEGTDSPKPVVNLDSDFEFELRTFNGSLDRGSGWFKSNESIVESSGWFEIQIRPRPSLRRLTPLAKDVVYVIDTSTSISSPWLRAVKQGVSGALDSLNAGDRFNVVIFRDNVRVLAPDGWLEASDESRKSARAFIDQAAVGGFTDVDRALRELVRRDVGADRVYQVIFISDGQPTAGAISPAQIIDVFTRANNLIAGIYCVAVGDEVDHALLGALAYRNKGYVQRPPKASAATAVIVDLASRLRDPILKDAHFSAAGVDPRRIYPRQPRDVYQHEPISIFGRFDPSDEKLTLRMIGQTPKEQMSFGSTLSFTQATQADRAVAQNWARAWLYHLTSELMLRPADSRRPIQQQIEQLRKTYDIK